MKLTMEIPDAIMQEVRLRAAELEVSVNQFVSEAVEEKIARDLEQIKPGESA